MLTFLIFQKILYGKYLEEKLWPKVASLLWLIAHKRIFTWDNPLNRGFTGPSFPPMYKLRRDSGTSSQFLCLLKIVMRQRSLNFSPNGFESRYHSPQLDRCSLQEWFPESHMANFPRISLMERMESPHIQIHRAIYVFALYHPPTSY